jgi:hypothetical protein
MANKTFRMTAAGTYNLQTAGGATLHSLVVTTPMGTSISMYDAAAATTDQILGGNPGAGSYIYDTLLTNGLTVVTVGTTGDISVTLG